MPIFVSKFSAERLASAGLGRFRNQQQVGRQGNAREPECAERNERAERGQGLRRGERAQDQMPESTQTAESIQEGVRNRTSGRFREDAPDVKTEAARRTLPTQATLPGVSSVTSRIRADTDGTPHVGRRDRDAESPEIRATLNRFQSLRGARRSPTASARTSELRQAFREIPNAADTITGVQARRLNVQVDASIRLLRSNR